MNQQRILFANIGWMNVYSGQNSTDIISGGGSYTDSDKHEAYNFQNLKGHCYGYVKPVNNTINLTRIDPSIASNAPKIENVTVVWFAPNKIIGGSWIVGWYKNATVYKHYQKSNNTAREKYGYYIIANYEDCTLLPTDVRTKQIPRQQKNFPGRSNIWYADSKDVQEFVLDIKTYIDNYTFVRPHRKHHIKFSNDIRVQVEKAAIKAVSKLYRQRGYIIKDVQSNNLGWDLEVSNGIHKLLLEVKGQSGLSPFIRISRNEYEKMNKNKDIYRLCIVMNAIEEPEIYVFINNNNNTWVLEDDGSIQLNIDEQVAAIATF